MEEKTIPQIICSLLGDADVIPFMPEVWREECGAVFLTGDLKRDALSESVGFEVAVRCGETAAERNDAIKCLRRIEKYFGTCDVKSEGARGYIVPVDGIRQVRAEKNGMAEYRAAYSLIREHSDIESAYRYYVNTGSKDSPVWSIVGEGFFLFDEKVVGEVFERRYFHEKLTRADVSGFSTEISYKVRLDSAAAAAVKLCEMSEGLSLCKDAVIEVLAVSCREDMNFPGAPRAILREYALLPSSNLREQGCLMATGKLLARGDGTEGRFVGSTGIFTAKG